MVYQNIGEVLAANEQSKDRFLAAVANINEAQGEFRPSEDAWTIAEIAEHVDIVSNGFLRITRKLLRQAEAEPKAPPAELNLGPTSLDENGNHLPKFEAPEVVRPKGGAKIADSLANLQQTLDGFAEIKPRLEVTDLSEQSFPHPALGPISAYKWIVLLGEHTDRHRLQIERVKATAGFPG